ncbi:uncharacterized protein LOC107883081 isoform X1 [Acyrthosiphon pisum]|uniref:Uncharacterized protein n=2 Tax=Acyrthosiphon pisum TaxID=7029 RepID=A0A8R2D2C9_ACYPI|nr:uncharacterized protein LOC107883081 isoform X1 [Acyrthosiphon pisum]|eukprot:XP_016657969.1 PREDICTED: uncharacterized protein LOC107883081 [Acyrthosiphon pisum]
MIAVACSSTQLTPMKILKVTNNEIGDNAASFKTPEKTQMTNSLAMMEPQVFTTAFNSVYDLSPIHLPSTIPHNVIPNTTSYNNMMPSDEMSSTADNAILRLILEKVSATLAYVQRIDEKISTGSVMTNNNIAINDEFLNLFPMKEVVSVKEIEKKLSTEIEFENQMIISN